MNINNKIFGKSKGNIKKILDIISHIYDDAGNIDSNIIEYLSIEDNDFFQSNADLWLDKSYLEDILIFLAAFSSINPISIDVIQLYLLFKGHNFSQPKIRKELKQFKNQLNIFKFIKITLSNSDFASYLLDKYYGDKDIEIFINTIFNWMVSPLKPNDIFIANTITFFINNFRKHWDLVDININKLVDYYSINLYSELLFNIGKHLYFALNLKCEVAIKFLHAASKLDNIESKSLLGYAYITGKKTIKDFHKGIQHLEYASVNGNVGAKRILGNILIENKFKLNRIEEGKHLLEEAINMVE